MMMTQEKGFTLIEILVAMVILSVSIIGIMALLPNDYRLITAAGRISAMNHIGQQTLDQLRGLPSSFLDLQEGTHPSTGCSGTGWSGIYGAVTCAETWPAFISYVDASGAQVYSGSYSVDWVITFDDPRPDVSKVELNVGYNMYESDGTPITLDRYYGPKEQRTVTFVTYLNR